MAKLDWTKFLGRLLLTSVIAGVLVMLLGFINNAVKTVVPLAWLAFINAVLAVALITWAITIRPGKEDVLQILITGVSITAVYTALGALVPAFTLLKFTLDLSAAGILSTFAVVILSEAFAKMALK